MICDICGNETLNETMPKTIGTFLRRRQNAVILTPLPKEKE